MNANGENYVVLFPFRYTAMASLNLRRHRHELHLDLRPLDPDHCPGARSGETDEALRAQTPRSLETRKANPAAALSQAESDSVDGRAGSEAERIGFASQH